MADIVTDEDSLSLEEYVKLPTTVDFQVINTARFREYARDKPYLHFGTEFANNYMIVYTNEKYIQGLLMDLGSDFLSFYPKIMSPLDSIGNDRSGITQVLNQPFLDLTGREVVAERGYGLDILIDDKSEYVRKYANRYLRENNMTLDEWREKYPDRIVGK